MKTTKYTDHEVTSYQDMNLFLADLGTGEARSLSDFADGSSVGRVSVSRDGTVAVLEGPKLGGPYLSETVKGRTNADHSITWTEVSVPYTGLWLIRLDTAERELLMRDENAMEFSPQFLPDGKRILFERRTRHLSPRLSDERPDTNIALYDTTSGRMRLLTRADRALDPKLAPDGRTVAFVRAIWPPDLWLADTEDGRMWQVDGGKRALIVSWTLNWTPDSRYVLFQSEGDVCAVSRTGRGPFHLTSGLQMPVLYGRGFSVQPDGKRIVYGTADGNVAVAALDWSAVPGYEPGTP